MLKANDPDCQAAAAALLHILAAATPISRYTCCLPAAVLSASMLSPCCHQYYSPPSIPATISADTWDAVTSAESLPVFPASLHVSLLPASLCPCCICACVPCAAHLMHSSPLQTGRCMAYRALLCCIRLYQRYCTQNMLHAMWPHSTLTWQHHMIAVVCVLTGACHAMWQHFTLTWQHHMIAVVCVLTGACSSMQEEGHKQSWRHCSLGSCASWAVC